MSLINDALRRASKADKERPYQSAAPAAMPMEPAEYAQKKSRTTVFIAAGILVALLCAGFFFRQWWVSRSNANADVSTAMNKTVPMPAPKPMTPPAAPVQPAPAPIATPPAAASVVSEPAPVPTPTPVVAAAAPAVAPVPAPAAAPIPAAPVTAAPATPIPTTAASPPAQPILDDSSAVWPTQLKLSAIFYGLNHPRVIINSGVYGIGDTIENVTVTKIEKNKVTVQWNNHLKELTMDQ